MDPLIMADGLQKPRSESLALLFLSNWKNIANGIETRMYAQFWALSNFKLEARQTLEDFVSMMGLDRKNLRYK